ncbi:hypothetical protein QTP70_001135 [Hemibagrus guttatus]|uniref:ribonuclease H n=1 Tax=Hemibagrus guttatus TaxID=175788 RepID=A0AAE0Q9U9_9TELE|nr:hypothetical protein QTP70_001135 [Hemibagrus guttatus]
MEKYRDGQRELHCVFVDLEKAYDRVPREELWYCMRKSGVAEKYVRVVQDMYERSRTVVRCAVGQTEEFNVEVGLHQGLALSPFLFAIVMDQLSEEVRQESPWTMMFADDIVICSESREQVEENLERWRFALERRGMKVSCSKTEYMCVNEREVSGTVRLQGEEVKKVQEFKYLGSTVQSNGECGKEVKKRVQAAPALCTDSRCVKIASLFSSSRPGMDWTPIRRSEPPIVKRCSQKSMHMAGEKCKVAKKNNHNTINNKNTPAPAITATTSTNNTSTTTTPAAPITATTSTNITTINKNSNNSTTTTTTSTTIINTISIRTSAPTKTTTTSTNTTAINNSTITNSNNRSITSTTTNSTSISTTSTTNYSNSSIIKNSNTTNSTTTSIRTTNITITNTPNSHKTSTTIYKNINSNTTTTKNNTNKSNNNV